MAWQLAVPGMHTVTVTNAPLTYPTGAPFAPRGPESTTIGTTFAPSGGAMPLFPALAPSLPPQPATAIMDSTAVRTRRSRGDVIESRLRQPQRGPAREHRPAPGTHAGAHSSRSPGVSFGSSKIGRAHV